MTKTNLNCTTLISFIRDHIFECTWLFRSKSRVETYVMEQRCDDVAPICGTRSSFPAFSHNSHWTFVIFEISLIDGLHLWRPGHTSAISICFQLLERNGFPASFLERKQCNDAILYVGVGFVKIQSWAQKNGPNTGVGLLFTGNVWLRFEWFHWSAALSNLRGPPALRDWQVSDVYLALRTTNPIHKNVCNRAVKPFSRLVASMQ